MQVDFYHLTQLPLERALPQIAEKLLANGERLLIVAENAAQRTKLDQLFWNRSPESFTPHGIAGGPDDARQPILITGSTEAPNGARNVALADGVWRDAALDFDRVFHFFDEERISEARLAWKGLVGREDITRNYWRQNDEGRWEKAA